MTLFELLAARVREFDTTFRAIHQAATAGDLGLARLTFDDLSVKLLARMHAVSVLLYGRLDRDDALMAEVAQARAEHDEIEQTIATLRIGALEGADWLRAVRRLERQVVDHLDFEDCMLLPFVRLALGPDEADQLVREYELTERMAASVSGPSITYEPVSAPATLYVPA